MPQALSTFESMMSDVDRLLSHHENFLERRPGRPNNDEGPLLRSCIVLIYAAWEYYFEESLIEVASILAAQDLGALPEQTRIFVAGKTKDPWSLAGDGWKVALVTAVTVYSRGVENNPTDFGINTANAYAVEEAHRKVLGVSILRQIRWPRATNADVRRRLDELVSLRGDIAHGRGPSRPLHLSHVEDWKQFVERLVAQYDSRLSGWLERHLTGLRIP